MGESEDPDSSLSLYSYSDSRILLKHPYTQKNIELPPSYTFPEYQTVEKTIKAETRAKTKMEEIEEVLEIEENPNLEEVC